MESSDLEGNNRKVVMMHTSSLFVDFALHGVSYDENNIYFNNLS